MYEGPCIGENSSNHVIMHVGTNHLSSETTPERIAKLIVDLIKNIKKENRSVDMSGIVPQNDTPNNKA